MSSFSVDGKNSLKTKMKDLVNTSTNLLTLFSFSSTDFWATYGTN